MEGAPDGSAATAGEPSPSPEAERALEPAAPADAEATDVVADLLQPADAASAEAEAATLAADDVAGDVVATEDGADEPAADAEAAEPAADDAERPARRTTLARSLPVGSARNRSTRARRNRSRLVG